MKKKLFLLAVALMCVTTMSAQLLYRISGHGLGKSSYVVGTFHLATSSFADKIPGIKQAMDETSQVYGELKWDNLANPDTLQLMQQRMMLPSGQTLKTVLTADQFGRLNRQLTKLMGVGLDNPMVMSQMGSMSPAALAVQLQMLQYLMAHMGEFDPTSTIDQYFQAQAKANNEYIGGLESVAFQSQLLYASQGMERQVAQLMCIVDNADYQTQLMERMAKAYYAQDLDALCKLMDEKIGNACDATDAETDALIYNRNARWAALMPGIMKSAPTLFVVGAGHLGGTRGVLQLLRQAGYTVEAVK